LHARDYGKAQELKDAIIDRQLDLENLTKRSGLAKQVRKVNKRRWWTGGWY
jgi:hypothetical protein